MMLQYCQSPLIQPSDSCSRSKYELPLAKELHFDGEDVKKLWGEPYFKETPEDARYAVVAIT